MITIRTSDTQPIIIDMLMKSPSVYLDHCVIGDFADNSTLGESFRNALQRRNGTLCLSALHLEELSGLCPGPSYSRIGSYLSSFGNGFVILEFDPNVVIRREKRQKEYGTCAAFDFELMKQVVLSWDGLSSLNVGILLCLLEENPLLCEKLRTHHRDYKEDVHKFLREAREIYQTDAQAKNNILTRRCPDPGETSMTEYLFCELRRVCFKEDLIPSATVDLFHSIVSTSYADFVVLDKKWASRVSKVVPRKGSATVFSTTEYDNLLRALTAS